MQHSAEWKHRVELAACYRLIAHYRMADLIYTHATLRLPDQDSRFLINPYGLLWEEISASSLVTIDLDGNKIGDNPYRVNRAGFVIHSAIHSARHDALCVIHTHTKAGMAVSGLQEGLLPLNQIALGLEPHVAYHDYEGIALDLEERDRTRSHYRRPRERASPCPSKPRPPDRWTQCRGGVQPNVLSQSRLRNPSRDAFDESRDKTA